MIQLQETCRDYKGPTPTTESVREGKLYAAKHSDGHWYRYKYKRTSILNRNLSDEIQIVLCVSVYFKGYAFQA